MVDTGYRELIVMRHAKTVQSAGSDRARELTARGRADARAAGRWLKQNDRVPDQVLTSPAARARATAEIVAAELTSGLDITQIDDLYGASAAETVEILSSTEAAVCGLLVVGHNPTMAELAHRLQREPADPWAPHLPTAGLVILRFPGEWADLSMGATALVHWHVPRG